MQPAPRGDLARWLARDLPALLPGWLPSQRWFGGKSRTLASAAIEDIVPLAEGDGAALVIVGARYADDGDDLDRYACIAAAAGREPFPAQVMSTRATADSGAITVVEGPALSQTMGPLLRALARGRRLAGDRGGSLVFDDVAPALEQLARSDLAVPSVRAIGHEQSNTSVRIGTTHVFKLIRRLQEGEHPQLEIGRFLRHTDFRAAPPLDGSISYRSPDHREYAVGVVEGWVENSGDGWQHVIDRLESAARDGRDASTLPDDFSRLGTTTADLHLALASDPSIEAFAPERVTARHLAGWRHEVLDQAAQSVSLVDRVLGGWPETLRDQGRALVGAAARLEPQVRALDGHVRAADFRLIRIHGDFHLGQTLKTADGFMLIDFEGEPTKPIARRRVKQCALKDVASMLRSIDYAAADVRGRWPAAAASTLDTTRFRGAFRDSYLARSRAHGGTFLPASAIATDALIALFELEKALYELDYEINNRPAWVHIPLAAVTRLLGIAA